MFKKFLKSAIYLASLTILSIGGAVFIQTVFAWTAPVNDTSQAMSCR